MIDKDIIQELRIENALLREANARLTAALDAIDRHKVGAYEVDWSTMPEPCEACGEMREIAAEALRRGGEGVGVVTCTCGQPIELAARGRRRKYCSEGCRRAADNMCKAMRLKRPKPTNCRHCSIPITQKATGRPREYCAACRPFSQATHVPAKPAQKVLEVS